MFNYLYYALSDGGAFERLAMRVEHRHYSSACDRFTLPTNVTVGDTQPAAALLLCLPVLFVRLRCA
jgi:hypothetical protein